MPIGGRAAARVPLVVFLTSALIVGYRGSAASGWVMYLDDVFIQHAVYSDVEYSGIRALLDPLGLFRSFSGYLHVVARLGAAVFSWFGLASLPVFIWVFATMVWAGCAATIAWAISVSTNARLAGLVAGVAFALAPFSNIVLLGQLNALQWPMLAVGMTVVISGARPARRIGWLGLGGFLVALALNAALSFLVLAMLAVRCRRSPTARSDRRLLVVAGIAFIPQIYAYFNQEARSIETKSLSTLLREFAYAFHTVVPSPVRWVYGTEATLTDWGAAVAWWLLVGAVLVVAARTVPRESRRRAGTYLGVALLFLALSVAMNGNLNHHYLVVPMTGLLLAGVEFAAAAQRRLPAILLAVAFGIASIGILPRTLNDSFFTQPFVGDWSTALAEARSGCSDTNAVVTIPGTSRPIRFPCSRR